MNTSLFLQQILTNYKEIGAVAPSSKFLVKKMLHLSAIRSAINIVEIGAGTGVITHEILDQSNQNAKVIVIETNEIFCEQLEEIPDERLKVYNRSATDLRYILTKEGIDKADCIISSLPLAMIPEQPKIEIMEAIHNSMHEHTLYVQYQYSLASYQLLQTHFSSTKVDFVLFNLPPAFVYTSTKK